MSLSLEVKKFINSEHTGEFVNVTLPSELPVRREEVRTVHRDTAAAESAKRRARHLQMHGKARNAPHNPPKRPFRMHTGMNAPPKKNCAKGKAAEVR